jgi:hypothetical protein
MIVALVTPPERFDLTIVTVTGQMQQLMGTGGRGRPTVKTPMFQPRSSRATPVIPVTEGKRHSHHYRPTGDQQPLTD